jgi:hypothetical protein
MNNEAMSQKDILKLALAKHKYKKSGGKVEKQPPTPAKGDEKAIKDIKDYRKKLKGIPNFHHPHNPVAKQQRYKYGRKKEEVEQEFEKFVEEVEIDEAKSKLPPHLAKFFDKDGNLKKDAAARVAKGKEKINWIDVTPKGYGPKEEVEKQTNLKEKIMDLEDTVKQVIGETNKKDKSEEIETEEIELSKEDAASFISAASKAKQDGKKKFKIGGKEYPVTIKVKIPEEKVELKKLNKEKVEKKESKSFSKMFSHIKSLMQGK